MEVVGEKGLKFTKLKRKSMWDQRQHIQVVD